jgi:hypothetical protein
MNKRILENYKNTYEITAKMYPKWGNMRIILNLQRCSKALVIMLLLILFVFCSKQESFIIENYKNGHYRITLIDNTPIIDVEYFEGLPHPHHIRVYDNQDDNIISIDYNESGLFYYKINDKEYKIEVSFFPNEDIHSLYKLEINGKELRYMIDKEGNIIIDPALGKWND